MPFPDIGLALAVHVANTPVHVDFFFFEGLILHAVWAPFKPVLKKAGPHVGTKRIYAAHHRFSIFWGGIRLKKEVGVLAAILDWEIKKNLWMRHFPHPKFCARTQCAISLFSPVYGIVLD